MYMFASSIAVDLQVLLPYLFLPAPHPCRASLSLPILGESVGGFEFPREAISYFDILDTLNLL